MPREPHLHYKDRQLMVEDIPVEEIVAATGTPVYIYSKTSFEQQLSQLTQVFQNVSHLICYSVKVCHTLAVVKSFVDAGCGLDIVSGGELFRGLKTGVQASKIVFSGVAKTEQEIGEAIEAGILLFNVESEQELERLDQIGTRLGKRVPVAIRVNPNINAKTHAHTTTGLRENKFGIDHEFVMPLYQKAKQMTHVNPIGIDCHIGSQILDVTPFGQAMAVIAKTVAELQSAGIPIQYIDVGGGLGIPYQDGESAPALERYAESIVRPFAAFSDITFVLEPGRFLTAQAGILVTRVQYTKENASQKKFVIVDTGMHHLIRPALYGAYHEVLAVRQRSGKKVMADIVGPICESADILRQDCIIEDVAQDDLLAILDSGAYGSVMASHYNSHALPVEVLVHKDQFQVIRKRERYEDLLQHEVME